MREVRRGSDATGCSEELSVVASLLRLLYNMGVSMLQRVESVEGQDEWVQRRWGINSTDGESAVHHGRKIYCCRFQKIV